MSDASEDARPPLAPGTDVGGWEIVERLGGDAERYRVRHPARASAAVLELFDGPSLPPPLAPLAGLLPEEGSHLGGIWSGAHDGRAFLVRAGTGERTLGELSGVPLARGAAIVAKLARAVAWLHERGVAHGAITIDAVGLETGDAPRLVGFGSSPESLEPTEATRAADIVALTRLLDAVAADEVPPSVTRTRKRVREAVYADAGSLAEDLERLRDVHRSVSDRIPIARPDDGGERSGDGGISGVLVLGGVVAVATLFAVLFIALPRDDATAPAGPAVTSAAEAELAAEVAALRQIIRDELAAGRWDALVDPTLGMSPSKLPTELGGPSAAALGHPDVLGALDGVAVADELRRAVALVTTEGAPRVAEARRALASLGDAASRPAIVLAVELAILAGDDAAARAALAAAPDPAEPLIASRLAWLDRAAGAATDAGIDAGIDAHIAEHGPPLSGPLQTVALARAVALAVAAGRSGDEQLGRAADRAVTLAVACGGGGAELDVALARRRLESGDPAGALAVFVPDRRYGEAARLVEAQAALASGAAGRAVAAARAASAPDGAPVDLGIDARLLEAEALIASGETEAALVLLRALISQLEGTPSTRPRPWARRGWRARVLHARAHAILGRFREARDLAERLAGQIDTTERAWRALTRFRDIDGTLGGDPDDAVALLVRGLTRVARGATPAVRRAGLRDVVRAARTFPDAVLLARDAARLADASFVTAMARSLPTDDGAIAVVAVTPAEELLAAALEDLDGKPVRDPDAAERALIRIDDVLLTMPGHAGAWLLRARCDAEVGRTDESGRALAIAARLAPEVEGAAAVAAITAADPAAATRAVERLLLAGAGPDVVTLARAARPASDGDPLPARLDALAAELGAIAGSGDPASLPQRRFAIATADGGDDALRWHLIGVARIQIAELHPPRSPDAKQSYATAADAFGRAAAGADDADRPIHETAAAWARVHAEHDDEALLTALDALLARADRRAPRGFLPPPGPRGLAMGAAATVHRYALDRAAILAHRAFARRTRGALDAARADAEAAAALDPTRVTALVDVYGALADADGGR